MVRPEEVALNAPGAIRNLSASESSYPMNHSSTPLLRNSIWASPVEVLSMERVVEAALAEAMSRRKSGEVSPMPTKVSLSAVSSRSPVPPAVIVRLLFAVVLMVCAPTNSRLPSIERAWPGFVVPIPTNPAALMVRPEEVALNAPSRVVIRNLSLSELSKPTVQRVVPLSWN